MSEQSTSKTVRVDVISDIMCPWCFIGMRNLHEAITQLGESIDVRVRWLPFQLDETLPKEGKDRAQYLSDKFGGSERADEIYGRIKDAGTKAGIDFDFSSIAVSPNTFDAHRLMALAERAGPDVQNALSQALFEAFFLQGRNIGNNEVLADIAGTVGLEPPLVMDFLNSDDLSEDVSNMLMSVRGAGISGVPFFIINQQAGLPGAQPPEILAEAISNAAQ